jgi:hypothetical protein
MMYKICEVKICERVDECTHPTCPAICTSFVSMFWMIVGTVPQMQEVLPSFEPSKNRI